MEYYFCKKHTLFLMMKMPGLIILKVKSFFRMIHPKSFFVKNKRNDDAGRILILDATIDDTGYILVNIYNVNTETEKIKVLNNFHLLLDILDIHQNK